METTMTDCNETRREMFGVRASPEEVERVQEYVRAHKNRELHPKTRQSLSRPLKEIAEALGMPAREVEAALRFLSFHQAADDARAAERETELPKFRPWGPEA